MTKLTGTPPRSQSAPRRSSSGQATIIILTLMAMATGVALVITRSVRTDIQITKIQEESARAFSAAEAGIEAALFDWEVGEKSPALGTGEVTAVSSNLGEGETEFVFPGAIREGDFGVIWLAAHDEDGEIDESSYYSGNQVRVCWEEGAALELVLFYNSGGYKTQRWAYDPNAGRRADNNFAAAGTGCAGLGASAELSLPGGVPLFLIAKVFYGSSYLGGTAAGGGVFPSQGKLVTSTGEVVSGANQVVSRRLKVLQTWDLPPLIFIDPVFSGSGIEAL